MLSDPESFWEIFFAPGRVTISSESGWYRRIVTDGRAMPEDPDESYMGTSVGHWDGKALVVETAGLNHTTQFSYHMIGFAPIGRHARVTERIFLEGPDRLRVDAEIVAPESLSGVWKVTQRLHRVQDHFPKAFNYCTERDPQLDPRTGAQRFDLTPPVGLPPPPK